MVAFLQLIRWRNLLIILLCQWSVYYFLREDPCSFQPDENIFLLTLSTLLLAAAGYIINDYSDVKIDVLNKPASIIVGKSFGKRAALALYFIFNISGMALGFIIHYRLGLTEVCIAWLLWRYSAVYKYKILIGNIVVSLMLSLSLLVVYFPYKNIITSWLLMYSVFAFLSGLIREIIKDVEDMEGDAAFGCRTIPIVYGVFKAKLILIYLTLSCSSILLFTIFYFVYWQQWLMASWLFILVFLPMLFSLIKIYKAGEKKDFSYLSSLMKLIMLSGIMSMALRLAVCQ